MSFTTGMDALLNLSAKQSEGFEERKPAVWQKLEDGQVQTFRFLQEFDPSHENYSEKNGLIVVAAEHVAPGVFPTPKAACTMESEDRCWACEQHKANPKDGWYIRRRLYANVLVSKGEGEEPEVQIMSQGIGNKGIFPDLLDIARDNDGLCDRPFKLTRRGKGQQTGYSIREGKRPDTPFDDIEKYEVYDLKKVCTRNVEYDKQAEFYSGGNAVVNAEPIEINVSAGRATGGGWPSEGGSGISGW